ncbi:hypothetical protein WA026_020618 [Henosepilachna vigintioctopunctata]|uniref:DH domain-containing protein n=1 Tax=Henosepilachna vigintioctopunctata TaxID=420089 RepID=A0AAW1V2B8_9CUCU
MAAIVSHAMRRYPLSPPDGVYSCNLRGENSSWSPKQEEGEGALSRSMRYADPWLYGSMRGAAAGALVLAPTFVLCSCPDYINGTKKGYKKKGPTVCKKCKGTRVSILPGNSDNKFGTVRCYSTSSAGTVSTSINATSKIRAGTVRVTSSSRPSILATSDPYDLMRRSRLNGTSEATSPFRQRSVSPTKRNNGPLNTSGRRSILECDINPYELMSTEANQPAKDSSITFVNGQRIRVRPPAPDPDYEDIDEKVHRKTTPKESPTNGSSKACNYAPKSTRPKPNRAAPDPPVVSPLTTSEADGNNSFKSILKKSSNSEDTIMFFQTTSRSKGASHFYLPFPTTPRKKVQFLMENSEKKMDDNEDLVTTPPNYETPECDEEFTEYLDVFEEEDNDESKVCTLRRSTSERFKFEPQKVVFHDTMALRCKPQRANSLETFNNCDLEKLDGLVPKRKISPRPKEPPPLPPPQDIINNVEDHNEQTQLLSTSKVKEDYQKSDIKNFTAHTTDEYDVRRTLSSMLKKLVEKNTEQLSKSAVGKSVDLDRCKSKIEELDCTSERKNLPMLTQVIQKPEELKSAIKIKEIDLTSDYRPNSVENNKPKAPPRKKSNNKQPYKKTNMNQKNDSDDSSKITHTKLSNNKLVIDNVEDYSLKRKNKKLHSINSQIPVKEIECNENTKKIFSLGENESVMKQLDSSLTETDVSSFNSNDNISNTIVINSENERKNEVNSNKTVVQVTPSSPVHRIQIKNEFSSMENIQTISIMNSTPRKTSIMINGDDCYSTVNVNDDVPLYQSSVVVRDPFLKEYSTNYTRRSSSVYIKGSFNDETLPESKTFKENEELSNNLSLSESCACKKSIGTEVTKEKKLETEVRIQIIEADPVENGTCCLRPSTPEMLRELLRDPVEAVKRNLVPHICGKSDVPRRPRDLKLRSRYPILPLKESVITTPDSKDKVYDKSAVLSNTLDLHLDDDKDACSEHSSSTQYEFVDPGSDCYTDHSNRSSVTEEEFSNRTKFYELLADSALLEISENEDHHYECISKNDTDPIYEEIEIPPPLPSNPPPMNLLDDLKLDKEFTTRSIFEGASKYDILSYLVDAKERGIVPEDSYTFSNISVDDSKESNSKICAMGSVSDSSEDNSLIISGSLTDDKTPFSKSSEVERNDSGVGSETSKSSLSKYRSKPVTTATCEDCEASLETLGENDPMLCRKCLKKRCERKEIIMEIVETEEKYSKDLQIVLEEFYQPMLVAGLLTPEQLSTIFLNVEELLENSQSLAERLRDTVEIATEQGDEDLLTVNIGNYFWRQLRCCMPSKHIAYDKDLLVYFWLA